MDTKEVIAKRCAVLQQEADRLFQLLCKDSTKEQAEQQVKEAKRVIRKVG